MNNGGALSKVPIGSSARRRYLPRPRSGSEAAKGLSCADMCRTVHWHHSPSGSPSAARTAAACAVSAQYSTLTYGVSHCRVRWQFQSGQYIYDKCTKPSPS